MSKIFYTKFEDQADGTTALMLQERNRANAEWIVVKGVDFTHTSDEWKHKFLIDYRYQLEDYFANGGGDNFSTYTNDRHDPLYADKIRDEIKLWETRKVFMV